MNSLMSDKDNKDISVMELKGKKYSISSWVPKWIFMQPMRAIGEYVGKEFGHKMRAGAVWQGMQHLQLQPLMPARRNRIR
jgi:hypothetical protein